MLQTGNSVCTRAFWLKSLVERNANLIGADNMEVGSRRAAEKIALLGKIRYFVQMQIQLRVSNLTVEKNSVDDDHPRLVL